MEVKSESHASDLRAREISPASDKAMPACSRELELPGYVVDVLRLQRIDAFVKANLLAKVAADDEIAVKIEAETNVGNFIPFESLDSFLDYCDKSPASIERLALEYRASESARVAIYLDGDGEISFTAISSSSNIEFFAEGLVRELNELDAGYGWYEKLLVFSRRPRRILALFVPLVSWLLAGLIAFFFYARRVGVDVNPGLLHDDNTYFKEVEAAIQSGSADVKLNTLLKGELYGFENVSTVLDKLKTAIGTVAATLVLVVVALLVLRALANLYPRANFVIGVGRDTYRSLRRKREVWAIAIGVAFVVNIAAGLVLAYFG